MCRNDPKRYVSVQLKFGEVTAAFVASFATQIQKRQARDDHVVARTVVEVVLAHIVAGTNPIAVESHAPEGGAHFV